MTDSAKKKRGSGCSCLALGCVTLAGLILFTVAAGLAALSLVEDAYYGEKLMLLVKHPAFVEGAKGGINESTKLSEKEKKLLLNFYDQLITEYDRLPPEKQKVIHNNIIVVIRKVVADPAAFEQNPPKEFQEMIQILGYPELDPDALQREHLKHLLENQPAASDSRPTENPPLQ